MFVATLLRSIVYLGTLSWFVLVLLCMMWEMRANRYPGIHSEQAAFSGPGLSRACHSGGLARMPCPDRARYSTCLCATVVAVPVRGGTLRYWRYCVCMFIAASALFEI